MTTIAEWKSKSLGKAHDVQRALAERTTAVKSSLANARVSVRDHVSGQVSRVESSMRTSPMLWAGVAAGSGFAIGLVGRFIHWRNHHRRVTPDLVIIDAGC